jgi:toxin ParE1/3/4
MKVVYSRRALGDLDSIAIYYSTSASPAIAESIERRLGDVIDRICRTPEAAPRLSQRSQVRVVAVVRYPFRIFYRTRGDTIDILHIRHTSRRPLSSRE